MDWLKADEDHTAVLSPWHNITIIIIIINVIYMARIRIDAANAP